MYKPDNTGKVRVVQEATSVKSPAIWFALHIYSFGGGSPTNTEHLLVLHVDILVS